MVLDSILVLLDKNRVFRESKNSYLILVLRLENKIFQKKSDSGILNFLVSIWSIFKFPTFATLSSRRS